MKGTTINIQEDPHPTVTPKKRKRLAMTKWLFILFIAAIVHSIGFYSIGNSSWLSHIFIPENTQNQPDTLVKQSNKTSNIFPIETLLQKGTLTQKDTPTPLVSIESESSQSEPNLPPALPNQTEALVLTKNEHIEVHTTQNKVTNSSAPNIKNEKKNAVNKLGDINNSSVVNKSAIDIEKAITVEPKNNAETTTSSLITSEKVTSSSITLTEESASSQALIEDELAGVDSIENPTLADSFDIVNQNLLTQPADLLEEESSENVFSPAFKAALTEAIEEQKRYLSGDIKEDSYQITKDSDGTRYVNIKGICWKIPPEGESGEWFIVPAGCNSQKSTFHFEFGFTPEMLNPNSPFSRLLGLELDPHYYSE